jgi:hypothetical protein
VNGRVLIGAGIVAALAGCGDEEAHYTYSNSSDCFKDVGKTQVMGTGSTSGQAVRISADAGKTYDVLFLPSGSEAKSYVKQLDVKTGVLHTKGNAIVYGHQTGTGAAVEEEDLEQVEKCLA